MRERNAKRKGRKSWVEKLEIAQVIAFVAVAARRGEAGVLLSFDAARAKTCWREWIV